MYKKGEKWNEWWKEVKKSSKDSYQICLLHLLHCGGYILIMRQGFMAQMELCSTCSSLQPPVSKVHIIHGQQHFSAEP